MGRSPCPKEGLTRGSWTANEDELLREHVRKHGEGKWGKISKETGKFINYNLAFLLTSISMILLINKMVMINVGVIYI